ncbi:MAG: hypothetical protein HY817_02265 [Candidatus Abawacabacteria bacterium]|nr:hypothetical protein [Candidatus Abawacabacteria bacterium]
MKNIRKQPGELMLEIALPPPIIQQIEQLPPEQRALFCFALRQSHELKRFCRDHVIGSIALVLSDGETSLSIHVEPQNIERGITDQKNQLPNFKHPLGIMVTYAITDQPYFQLRYFPITADTEYVRQAIKKIQREMTPEDLESMDVPISTPKDSSLWRDLLKRILS